MSALQKLKEKKLELTPLEMVVLSESNYGLQQAAAAELATLREQVADVNELLWEFAENPNIELGEKGHSKIEDYFKKYAKQEAQ